VKRFLRDTGQPVTTRTGAGVTLCAQLRWTSLGDLPLIITATVFAIQPSRGGER
jgi:hypothetical protein